MAMNFLVFKPSKIAFRENKNSQWNQKMTYISKIKLPNK